ncbi:hypothetical protein [Brevibacterium aurantiacum]|uniref:hypothetical protein n=1 Tax=Brevibacterium aurantiacum TaxID=273384 RepID=UPI001868A4DA|nr:hypothetical protein [Brevibacterium aurantiacum]
MIPKKKAGKVRKVGNSSEIKPVSSLKGATLTLRSLGGVKIYANDPLDVEFLKTADAFLSDGQKPTGAASESRYLY